MQDHSLFSMFLSYSGVQYTVNARKQDGWTISVFAEESTSERSDGIVETDKNSDLYETVAPANELSPSDMGLSTPKEPPLSVGGYLRSLAGNRKPPHALPHTSLSQRASATTKRFP